MQRQFRAVASHFFRNAAAYAVFSIGLALTVAAHEYVAGNLRISHARVFDEESEDAVGRLRHRIDTYLTMTLATRGLFSGGSIPTAQELEGFARNLEISERAPGMHGLGFAVFSSLATPLEESAPGLLIDRPVEETEIYVQLGPRMRVLPADRWIDPPAFQRSIAIARDEGRIVATQRVAIDSCDENTFSPGFVLFAPIYASGDIRTVEDRRAAMRGVVFATFCARAVLNDLLHAHTRRSLDIEIYDGAVPRAEVLLADTDPVARGIDEHDSAGERFLRDVVFDVAGQSWLVHFASLGTAQTPGDSLLPRLVAFGGVMLSFLLFAIVLSQVRSRGIAEAGERRSQIVANAGRVFTAYPDEREAVNEVVRFAVPHAADWCAISLFEGETAELYSFGFTDAAPEAIQKMMEACRVRPTTSLLLTGQTELVADARFPGSVSSIPEEVLTAFGARSVVRAPMTRQGQMLGLVTFVVTRPLRRLGPNDVLLAGELARVVCTSIDGARLYRRTQEASRLKDEFLATLSHELRTPLNAILGWAHLLRSANLEEATRQRAAETIERNARQQTQIVSDLLDVSRIILGQVNLERAPVELAVVVQDAIESQRLAAEAKRISVEVSVDPEASLVLGDRARLHQIVWNLVSNAIKFTPNEGRVVVEVAREGEMAEIRVRDTGQGISPEFLPHIFERFRQADASTTRAHGGLGLGLAIVRHLVELHGGTIQAASTGSGAGSTFIVRIPAAAKSVATFEQAAKRRESTNGKQQAS